MSDTNDNQTGGFGHRDNGDVQRPIVPKSATEVLRPQPGVPRPKKQRSKVARSQFVIFMNFVMSLLVFVVLGAGMALYIGKQQFEEAGPATEAKSFVVPKGAGISEIALSLERNGLISNARTFNLGTKFYKADKQMKAGEYEIKAGSSMRDIMETLKSGKSVLYSLTIPEGLTVEQVLARIKANDVLTGDMPVEVPPEGWLLTDTQRFSRGTSRTELIAKMVADQKKAG